MPLSSYFSTFYGPWGGCPVQLTGYLKTGEYVYFRARGSRVELEISKTREQPPHALYLKELHVLNHELGTGVLPAEICTKFICRWLDDYLKRPEETYFVREDRESITI